MGHSLARTVSKGISAQGDTSHEFAGRGKDRLGIHSGRAERSRDRRNSISHDARQFDVESRDTHVLSRPASGEPSVRSFHYDRPGDVLVVRPRSTGISNSAKRFASLQLTSYLNAAGADDLHRATFSIAPELAPQPFHFRLAADSRLCSVAVNGQPVRVQRRDDDVTVPSLPSRCVELRRNRIQNDGDGTALPREPSDRLSPSAS